MSSIEQISAAQDAVRDLLRAHGLRPTRQREVLYSALAETKAHPTAEELFESVLSRDSGMSLATVYNALEAFTTAGLCRRLAGARGGACRFDADMARHVHVVSSDGRVVDLPEDLSAEVLERLGPDLVGKLELRLGFRLGRVSVQIVSEG